MITPDGYLIRTAFLTKYGYSAELTYEEILREFRRRYDQAQVLRQENAGTNRIMLIIEGMSQSSAQEAAFGERQARKRKIARLAQESGFGALELDQLVEGLAGRLEADWIGST